MIVGPRPPIQTSSGRGPADRCWPSLDREFVFDTLTAVPGRRPGRCPHISCPPDRGSVEDGILTGHWHHARFDLESGCTFDLWADDTPTCPVKVREGEVWVKSSLGHADTAADWGQRLEGLAG